MSDYEIEPTIEQLSDPYVLQLIRGISDLMDKIEELEAEVERLSPNSPNIKFMEDANIALTKRIAELEDELKMEEECFENLANDFKRVEGENRKLRYVMETAQTMRDDYDCYSLSEDGTYGTELHDPEIMKDFDNAIKAMGDE